jgi:hypothetical protein
MTTARRSRRDPIRAAWLEWLVAQQMSTGDGEGLLMQIAPVPGWFKAAELGLAWLEGPSIFWTFENLEQINRSHLYILLSPLRKKKAKHKERAALEKRRRDWRALVDRRAASKKKQVS